MDTKLLGRTQFSTQFPHNMFNTRRNFLRRLHEYHCNKVVNETSRVLFSNKVKPNKILVESEIILRLKELQDSFQNHAVETRESSTHGIGVFAKQLTPRGSLLGFYPGVFFERETLVDHFGSVSNYDPDDLNDKIYLTLEGRLVDPTIDKWPHKFAFGQFLNHPPPHSKPNCLFYSLDIPNTSSLASYIPSKVYGDQGIRDYVDSDPVINTVVVLNTENLRAGDELFVDYNLHVEESDSLPYSWYAPVHDPFRPRQSDWQNWFF